MNAKKPPAVAGGVLIVMLLVACGSSPSATLAPSTGATLAQSITDVFADADWYPAVIQKDGHPWVEIIGQDAFVHFAARMDGASIAMQVCQAIAAATNDPTTVQPLGIVSVVVYANGHIAAQCHPPK